MAFTFSDLLQAVYAELGQLQTGTISSGSTTTVIDGEISGWHKDGDWKNGAIFIIDVGGAAPEGEFSRISGYDDSAGQFDLATALSAAVSVGDNYGFVSAYYSLGTMIELVNAGLRTLGDIALVNTTTLDSSAGQSEYTATVNWKRRRPMAIDYQGQPGVSGNNQWVRVYDWEYVPSLPGEDGLIIFNEELPAGRDVRIWYVDRHPRLSQFDDVVSETIALELAVAAGVERALRYQNSRLAGSEPFLVQRWNDAKVELARAQVSFPVWTPRRVANLMQVRAGSV
ncbi:MAG: hypothetical protein DWQ07_23240 [Chloroflexi bacterium]|nr:MAG: hypothetical protein DWQ07_23240 [Chloroflexota bacterium]MBL1194065.1 hypothetical protein [Chloroflexota bacterium]NOH11359.1 hypothetical protein [Chloroflexota bacterium]